MAKGDIRIDIPRLRRVADASTRGRSHPALGKTGGSTGII